MYTSTSFSLGMALMKDLRSSSNVLLRDQGLSLLWDWEGEYVEWEEPKSDLNVSLLPVPQDFGRICGVSEVTCSCDVPKSHLDRDFSHSSLRKDGLR